MLFRSGSSPDHLQEFTNLEFYWAYADYEDGMHFVQGLYQHIAKSVYGTTKFSHKGLEFDLAGEWPRIDYLTAVEERTGINLLTATDDEMRQKLEELGVKYEGTPKFEIFKDRLVITSCGGLPYGISQEEFFSGTSIPRNKELMRIFRDVELVEHLGSGIPRILQSYPKESFKFMENTLRVIFPIDEDLQALMEEEAQDTMQVPSKYHASTMQVTPQVPPKYPASYPASQRTFKGI